MEKIIRRISLLVLLCVPLTLPAHQQKQAVTNILLNRGSDLLEIDHRFYLHDIEQVLNEVGTPYDLLLNSSAQRQVANYVERHFTLSNVELTLVGYEVDGIFFRVYQQSSLQQLTAQFPALLQITMDALFDIWPEQQNLINISDNQQLLASKLYSRARPSQVFIIPATLATQP